MLMKWLIRLAFPALGLLLVLIFFGLGDPEQVTEPDAGITAQEIPAFEGLLPSPVATEGPEVIFKWQDTDGNWQFADTPPPQGPWNALAIEQPGASAPRENPPGESGDDWQAPYKAPFSLDNNPANNDS